ncbi:MAG: Crp/Fnr family transcriptional regulator [Proteocatella sp.]
MPDIDLEFVRNTLPFWEKLTNKEKEIIKHNIIQKKFLKNTILIHGGDDCTGFLLVKSGQLRIYSHSSEGKQITLYRLLEMDSCIFSASCLLKNINFDISIDVEKDSELFIIPSDIFNTLSNENLAVKSFMLDLVTSRFSDVMWIFEQYVFTNMASRLASVLLEQASLNDTSVLEITHDYISKELGTAREVVTRLLKQFQSDEFVRISRNKIEILDEDSLQKLIG